MPHCPPRRGRRRAAAAAAAALLRCAPASCSTSLPPTVGPAVTIVLTRSSFPVVPGEGVLLQLGTAAGTAEFHSTGGILVIAAGGDCATATSSVASVTVSGYFLTDPATRASASALARFSAPGEYRACYAAPSGAPELAGDVVVHGADRVTFTTVAAATTLSGLPTLRVNGTQLDGRDTARVVRGANCGNNAVDERPTVDPAAGDGRVSVDWTPSLPGGGKYLLCWRPYANGRVVPWHAVGQPFSVAGAAGYYPTTVPLGSFALTFEGINLTAGAGGDAAIVVPGRNATCAEADASAASSSLYAVAGGKAGLAAAVSVPGTYTVCYRIASLSGADDYLEMAEPLTVVGPRSYAPASTQGGVPATLTFFGIGLDSTAVGDSAKLVRGSDCLNDPAVVVSNVPGVLGDVLRVPFSPPNLTNQTQLALAVSLPEGGRFTVCYKVTTGGEYTPLSPQFQVSGASAFYPTVVSQAFTGTLYFEGALLDTGDSVAVAPPGHNCSSAAAVPLPWRNWTAVLGQADVTDPGTLAASGEYTMCFTPAGGRVYPLAYPLTVTGVPAGGITPSELIAGVEDVVTVAGTVQPTDQIKLVKQGTEQCSSAFPGHGSVAPLTQVGTYSAMVPYGGLFTLCYSSAGAAFAPAVTLTVRGPRELSPYSPVVTAAGIAVEFEFEGAGLSSQDTVVIVQNGTAGCAAPPQTGIPPLSAPAALRGRLSTTAGSPVTFAAGGAYLVCYSPSGGPQMPLRPPLVVKGARAFDPVVVPFANTSVLNFSGIALSAQDELLLSRDQLCADDAQASPHVVDAGVATVSPARGGTYYVCYRAFEGGYVALPTQLAVHGPDSILPSRWSSNVTVRVAVTGEGLRAGDRVAVARATDGCGDPAAFLFDAPLSGGLTAAATVAEPGNHLWCYQLQGRGWALLGSATVTGAESYAPAQVKAGEDVVLVVSGVGLRPATDRVVIADGLSCPTAPPGAIGTVPGTVYDGTPTGTNSSLRVTAPLQSGGAARHVCHWDGVRWAAVGPPADVGLPIRTVGPVARTAAAPELPLSAGVPVQYIVSGEGLMPGVDRVKWVRIPLAGGGMANCSAPAERGPAAVLAAAGGNVLTPPEAFAGGNYAMCYSTGVGGDFIPIGVPVGGGVGGAVGEVVVAGPRSWAVASAGQPRAGQYADLSFAGPLLPSTQHEVFLADAAGGCAAGPAPAEPATPSALQNDTAVVSASVAALAIAPLRGGEFHVCYRTANGSGAWPAVALPMCDAAAAAVAACPAAGAPPGVLTVDGPTAVSVTAPPAAQLAALVAGQAYEFFLPRVPGTSLSTNASAARWVEAGRGCLDAGHPAGLATTASAGTGAMSTTFHLAGRFQLCYLFPGDVDRVSRFALTAAWVVGMHAPARGSASGAAGATCTSWAVTARGSQQPGVTEAWCAGSCYAPGTTVLSPACDEATDDQHQFCTCGDGAAADVGWARVPFGRDTAVFAVGYTGSVMSPDAWLWPAAAAGGAAADMRACPPPSDLAALGVPAAAGGGYRPAPVAARGMLYSAGAGVAQYNATHAPAGAYRVCVRQGPAAGYVALPGVLTVEGPESFYPSSVTLDIATASGATVSAPRPFEIQFDGAGLNTTDRVRMVPLGAGCAAPSPFHEQSLGTCASDLTTRCVRTPAIAAPSRYTVCYRMGQPAGRWVALRQTFEVTGPAAGLALDGALPAQVVAMQPFAARVRLVDAEGSIVPRGSGTVSVAADDSPGVPVPASGSALTQAVAHGRAGFNLSLGTLGTHYLLFVYEDPLWMFPPQRFRLSAGPIEVVGGGAAHLATTFSGGEVMATAPFSVPFQTVDAGYNLVALPFVEVAAVLTPLGAGAGGGALSGDPVAVAGALGAGSVGPLSISRAGRYSLSLVTTNASGAQLSSRPAEVLVAPGPAAELRVEQQWAEGTVVAAGTLLVVEVAAYDAGGNMLHVDAPAPMFIRVARATPTRRPSSYPSRPPTAVPSRSPYRADAPSRTPALSPPSASPATQRPTSHPTASPIASSPPAEDQREVYRGDPDLCSGWSPCAPFRGSVLTKQGVATFENLWLRAPGAYQLEVVCCSHRLEVTSLAVVTRPITVTLGVDHHLRVLEGPLRIRARQRFAYSVGVVDRAGNLLPNAVGTASCAVAPPHSAVRLAGGGARALSGGIAIFRGLRVATRGVYRLRFKDSRQTARRAAPAAAGLVGDSGEIFVDVPARDGVALRPFLAVHLDVPPASLNEEQLRADAAAAAGLPGPEYVEVVDVHDGPGGGAVAYLLFTGTEDADGRAARAAAAANDGSAGVAWQGGGLAGPAEVTYEPGDGPGDPPAASGGGDDSSLEVWEIALIAVACVLLLCSCAIVAWYVLVGPKSGQPKGAPPPGREKERELRAASDYSRTSYGTSRGSSTGAGDSDYSHSRQSRGGSTDRDRVSENPIPAAFDDGVLASPHRNAKTPAVPRDAAGQRMLPDDEAADADATPGAAGARPRSPRRIAKTPLIPDDSGLYAEYPPWHPGGRAGAPARDPGGDPVAARPRFDSPSPPPDRNARTPEPPPEYAAPADYAPPQPAGPPPLPDAGVAEWARQNAGVAAWLRGLRMERYLAAFAGAGMTMQQLYEADAARLSQLGVADAADRGAMLRSLHDARVTAALRR